MGGRIEAGISVRHALGVPEAAVNIPEIRGLVEAAGYAGFNEAEIFSSRDWWKRDPDKVVATCIERHEWAV